MAESRSQQIHQYWMRKALHQARVALTKHEVPVGAVVVIDGEVAGEGHNGPLESCDPTAHAEIQALRDACRNRANYRLPESTLYATLEPCIMCAGALLNARVAEVVFAARDPVAGAGGSVINLLDSSWLNSHIKVTAGVCAEESTQMLQSFFKKLRRQQALK